MTALAGMRANSPGPTVTGVRHRKSKAAAPGVSYAGRGSEASIRVIGTRTLAGSGTSDVVLREVEDRRRNEVGADLDDHVRVRRHLDGVRIPRKRLAVHI